MSGTRKEKLRGYWEPLPDLHNPLPDYPINPSVFTYLLTDLLTTTPIHDSPL